MNSCEKIPKEMWKTISKLTNKTSKITNIGEINQNGNRVTDDGTIANFKIQLKFKIENLKINWVPRNS